MTRKAPNKIFIYCSISRKIRVWLETQKPAWTGLRRTNGENRVIMKKWNLIGKNKYFLHFLMKTWNEEDPYGILFHIAVCPEEPCGIDFFKKSSENRDPKKSQKNGNPKSGQNRFKIDVNRLNMELKILPDRFWRALNLFWHDFKGYYT